MKTTFEEFINESVEPGKWFISYGLGGGFGGADNFEVIEAESEDEARLYAWQMACEDYEQYVGLHGLRTIGEIMEEDDVDEEEAEQIYNEEKESWLDYSAEPYDPEKHDNFF